MAEQKPKRSKLRIWIGLAIILLIAWLWDRQSDRSRLMATLGDNDLSLRTAAARTLLQRKALAESLPTQPIIRRSKTAEILPEVGTPEAIELLVTLLADQENAPQRRAISSLARIGSDAIPYVLPLLASGTNRSKPAAVEVLTRIGAPTLPALRAAMSDFPSRAAAAQALANIGRKGNEAAYQPLLLGARSSDDGMRDACIAALGEKRNREAVEPAIAGLSSAALTLTCIRALGRIGDARATEKLFPYLREPLLRTDAARALGGIADPRAIGPLLPALGDEEQTYREAAVFAFRRIGKPAVSALTATLKSPKAGIRRSAAQAMLGIESPEMVAPLSVALKDPDPGVRLAAAKALGWEGNSAAVSALIAAFGDSDYRVTDAAIAGLAQIGVSAQAPLISLFRSDPTEALYASRALALMGKAAFPRLAAAAESGQEDSVRKWAAITLGEMADPRAVAVLKKIEANASGDLRWVVQQQLSKFGA